MTELSPAAQAVYDAFWSHPNGKPLSQDSPDTDQLIAALCALADQVVPAPCFESEDQIREAILSIALELEGAQ